MRILINYFQVSLAISSFDLSWPLPIAYLFTGFGIFTDPFALMNPLECLFKDFGLLATDSTFVYYRTLIIGLSPLVYYACIGLAWFTLKFILRSSWAATRDRILSGLHMVLFLLHPIVSVHAFGLFNCY